MFLCHFLSFFIHFYVLFLFLYVLNMLCFFVLFQNLANKYSNELDIDKNICITALQELQKHALDKLHDKEVYQETGVAIIKVKLSGNIVPGNITNSRILSIHTTLSSLTSSLQKAVSEQIDVTPEK